MWRAPRHIRRGRTLCVVPDMARGCDCVALRRSNYRWLSPIPWVDTHGCVISPRLGTDSLSTVGGQLSVECFEFLAFLHAALLLSCVGTRMFSCLFPNIFLVR